MESCDRVPVALQSKMDAPKPLSLEVWGNKRELLPGVMLDRG